MQRATLDNLHEAVAVFGPDGRLNLTNFGYRQMLGITEEVTEKQPHVRELLDRVIDLWEEPGVYTEMRESLWIASATEMRAGNGRMELPDGRIVDYAATGLPDARTLFTYIDVTDSLRIERALRERNEALVAADLIKSEFLENMSYDELRTPLNTILGFAEILHNDYFGTLNERQREYSSGILEASGQFLSMINDMLDLASIRAGHLHVDMEPFRIADAIDLVLEKYRDRAQRRQIACGWTSPGTQRDGQRPATRGADPGQPDQQCGEVHAPGWRGRDHGKQGRGHGRTVRRGQWHRHPGGRAGEGLRDLPDQRPPHPPRRPGWDWRWCAALMELMGGSVVLRSESGVGTRVSCRFIAIDAEFDQDFEDVPTPALSGMVVPVSGPADKPEA